MDLDAYSAAHREEWDRLASLASRRRFSGAESDELIERYQAGATELSAMTTTLGQSVQGDRLSLSLSRARLRFTGASTNALAQLPRFFAYQLPAALYRVRWVSLAATVAFFVIAFAYGAWLSANPELLLNFGSAEQLETYADTQFIGYYSDNPEASFAGQVWTNNAWIAAQCIAFGVTAVWAPYMIVQNALGIGQSGAIMNEYGRLDQFFLYLAPHGQLELYCIFVAAAAGMMIAWSWIAPGARTRGQALAEDGRALFTIVVGLAVALLVSGIIEGYVTRQDWPWPIKIGIGSLALAAFVGYQWVLGGRAAKAGETGDLDEFESGARRLVAG
ncbi:putative membrane protein SpoIIM required for sporulation [Glaciihabitans tibetensis]|uniref:Putative membrane protein SpoIIM required for sporulation n=1 Tax=Glaciihabitans tibetensis TaxID=1266600 RepID=A0A2T0VFJ3_9MICO|nr:stage II sporulation protein M [Glaciihabitans tibetensis]PRY68932.1 putative membrane protein SpoIIM required for sporulation [Glaciihabitans tibetensis]